MQQRLIQLLAVFALCSGSVFAQQTIADGLRYGANCTNTSSDAAAITAANTAAAAVGGDLIIRSTCNVTSNVTISSNVKLVFQRLGRLAVATGVVFRMDGGLEAAPDQQIFSLTGTGRVIFGGVDCTTSCTSSSADVGDAVVLPPMFYAKWWGVVGNATADDTAAVQAIFNVLPNFARLDFLALRMKITATLNLKNRRNIYVTGRIGSGGVGYGEPQSSFIWAGADGGTMANFARVRDAQFSNLSFFGSIVNTPTNGADICVWLNQDSGTDTNISSNNTFTNCYFFARSKRSGHIGVYVGGESGTNDEFHKFYHCTFLPSNDTELNTAKTGVGIYLRHGNVKQVEIVGSHFSGAASCIRVQGGSFKGTNNKFGYSDIAYDLIGASDSILLMGDDSEEVKKLFKFGQAGSPVTLIGGRYSRSSALTDCATAANPWMEVSGSTILTIVGNTFGYFYHTSQDSWYENSRSIVVNNNVGRLIWDQNTFNELDQLALNANFQTFRTAIVDGVAIQGASAVAEAVYPAPSLNYSTGLTAQPLYVQLYGSVGDTAGINACTLNNVCIADGRLEITGLARPGQMTGHVYGTTGATAYIVSLIAKDAAGRRTMRGPVAGISNANATLSASNKIKFTWAAVPGVTGYDIIQTNPAVSTEFRVIAADVTGTSYELTANPAGAYTYTLPTHNETGGVILRGKVVAPLEVTFSANDATPSVGGGSHFVTANGSATSVTTFDDGTEGQEIHIRINDANTTLVNGATLVTGTGANISAVNGAIYTFEKRGTVWCRKL